MVGIVKIRVGSKAETKDGAFSRGALRHRRGMGYTPYKARRRQNKKVRSAGKNNF